KVTKVTDISVNSQQLAVNNISRRDAKAQKVTKVTLFYLLLFTLSVSPHWGIEGESHFKTSKNSKLTTKGFRL
ncbi:hypothetical protein, partial [Dysgonomonas sp. UBA7710]|uniref:hypothetical protein n=1 Tax=Dysgonomonas sp. UBA7710 TaxID=1946428 RepID=UPI0025C07307